ncbi:hypothetical protein GJ496_011543 [Pomphorhynchus laevis]|nr:hypothetical protein GJ496_011543 [Pomphorhynchus laevis]
MRTDVCIKRLCRYVKKINDVPIKVRFEYFEKHAQPKCHCSLQEECRNLEVDGNKFEDDKHQHLGLATLSFERFINLVYILLGVGGSAVQLKSTERSINHCSINNCSNNSMTQNQIRIDDKLEKIFLIMDSNNDGLLSYEDMWSLFDLANAQSLKPDVFRNILKKLRERNRGISFESYYLLVKSGQLRNLLMWRNTDQSVDNSDP